MRVEFLMVAFILKMPLKIKGSCVIVFEITLIFMNEIYARQFVLVTHSDFIITKVAQSSLDKVLRF